MTLVVIGPVTRDLIFIGDKCSKKVGGATYFQSFVFEEFYRDYLAIVNCGSEDLVIDFPDLNKVKVIKKDNTHFFINEYPDPENLDIRRQSSNFADIPILKSDIEHILENVNVDGFVLTPLNRFDFPLETIEYIKSFNVPVFISIQGFLRVPGNQVNDNYSLKLDDFDKLTAILSGVDAIFLDESEKNIIGTHYDVGEMVITDGSRGSRIVGDNEIKILPLPCENVVDTTGCGDTFMAAYVTQKLLMKSSESAGNFASRIASEKIRNFGPYNPNR